MAKKTVADINVKGKKVLMRVDFNVPLDDDCNITSDTRIVAALPTIKTILDKGGSVILMSHLGRPDGERVAKYSLAPVAKKLGELLKKNVIFAIDCVGPEAKKKAAALKPGDCLLLENVRFHKEEEIKDKDAKDNPALRKAKDEFAKQMAELGDVYVDDAFGTAHRDNASMYTVPAMMKGKDRVIGFLVEKELKFLDEALNKPKRPFVAILGGAKVSDKLKVIENLMKKVDRILIGGAMAFTFFKAKGLTVGKSLCEEDFVDKAKQLLTSAKKGKCELVIPPDSVIVQKIEANTPNKAVPGSIPDGWIGVDIGPDTMKLFSKKLEGSKTVVWNGPMGIFEMLPFDEGTKAVAQAVAKATDNGAVSVIGGGDSASAIKKLGLSKRVSHVSTGGGASLEFLEGKKFVCLEVLDEK